MFILTQFRLVHICIQRFGLCKLQESQDTSTSDLRGYWQPKVKKSLAERLPEDCFHLIPPNRYIFPGAEVYYDPDEKLHYENNSSSSSSESEESDDEGGSREANEAGFQLCYTVGLFALGVTLLLFLQMFYFKVRQRGIVLV